MSADICLGLGTGRLGMTRGWGGRRVKAAGERPERGAAGQCEGHGGKGLLASNGGTGRMSP